MADLKGSAATLVTTVSDTTRLLASDSATDKAVSGAQLKSYVGVAVNAVKTADQVVGANALDYISGSGIIVPVGKLRIGTVLRWTLQMSKSAAGTAALAFLVKMGTAGTSADATIITLTTGIQTAAADEAWVDIMLTLRGPLSSAGVFEASIRMTHELATTGFLTKATDIKRGATTAADVTVAGLIVGLLLDTGASHSITIRQCLAEATNL